MKDKRIFILCFWHSCFSSYSAILPYSQNICPIEFDFTFGVRQLVTIYKHRHGLNFFFFYFNKWNQILPHNLPIINILKFLLAKMHNRELSKRDFPSFLNWPIKFVLTKSGVWKMAGATLDAKGWLEISCIYTHIYKTFKTLPISKHFTIHFKALTSLLMSGSTKFRTIITGACYDFFLSLLLLNDNRCCLTWDEVQ